MKHHKAIALVGIMGSGKTCVAKKLAKKLGVYHIDTDKEIKEITGLSIKEFVENNREKELKEIEFEIIQTHTKKKCIISTGDYTVNNQKTWDYLMQHALTIWINASLSKILIRLRPNENRPFFSEELTFQNFQKLYNARKKRYMQAKIHVQKFNSEKLKELIQIIDYYTLQPIIL